MEEQKWTKMSISGRLMVSDFGRLHCTHDFTKDYPREEVVPGAFLNTPSYYDGVLVVELDGEDVMVKIGGETKRLTPGERVFGPNHPLDYAWSELCVSLK